MKKSKTDNVTRKTVVAQSKVPTDAPVVPNVGEKMFRRTSESE